MVVVVIYTNLSITPFWIACLVSVLLFAGVTARMVSASALMTAIPAPEDRGAFMSINSAIMQLSGGAASVIAGLIVSQSATGMIEHYDTLGYVVVGTMLVMTGMLYFINRSITRRKVTPALIASPEDTGVPIRKLAGETV
jgi:predicted MFS family arabinose efflux permease